MGPFKVYGPFRLYGALQSIRVKDNWQGLGTSASEEGHPFVEPFVNSVCDVDIKTCKIVNLDYVC